MGSISGQASNFSTPHLENQHGTLIQGKIIICSDRNLLWQDSDKGVDHTSALPESILLVVMASGWGSEGPRIKPQHLKATFNPRLTHQQIFSTHGVPL